MELRNLFEDFLSKSSIFENKEALTIKYTPSNIPHREKEIATLAKMLAPALRMERPSNIFIYGKTGTGKSLVVSYVTNELLNVAKEKNVPLKIIYINCKMRRVADTEYRLIAQLAREFGQEIPATGLPTDEVYKIFFDAMESKGEQVVILVLDEIDRLVQKAGDDVLYNLTRINQELKYTKLSIIGISNDVLFKQNIDPRVRSSLGDEDIVFPPYDALQLKDILKERAKIAFRENAIDDSVIAKCAAYAAREHGDARRALDLLRVAGELAERDGKSFVDESYVDKAQEKIESESIEEVVRKLPNQSQLVLYSTLLIAKSREGSVYTGEIYDLYRNFCIKTGTKPLTQRRLSDLISELDMLGMINAKVISKGRYGRTREISMAMSDEMVERVEFILRRELNL